MIFPIRTGTSQTPVSNDPGNFFNVTGKELIARAVLRSKVVNVCVLDSVLAKKLANAVGVFLIQSPSPKPAEPYLFRKAISYDLVQKKERTIAIHDPKNRLDTLRLKAGEGLQPTISTTDTMPSIIFSELTDEDKNYHWEAGYGQFEYHIDRNTYVFQVDKGVRRPGIWSIMTAMQGARYLGRHGDQQRPGTFSIWDMGCGCGVIGILLGRMLENRVSRIFFSDIDPKAIECTRRNVASLGLNQNINFNHADLFDAKQPNEQFDMILFNPPFSPMAGINDLDRQIDAGGSKGNNVAARFCENVYDHLKPGGWAVIAVADYIDDGHLQKILENCFGHDPSRFVVHNRYIFYPYKTERNVPQAFEIRYRETIEKNCRYSFETCFFGEQKFLSFHIRHYLVQLPL